jgi:phosphatidylglycerophosphatase A
MRKLILFFSSNAGLGYAPFASGTVGTLAGIPVFYLTSAWPWWLSLVTLLALLFLSFWIADAAGQIYGVADDGRIVIDELIGYLVTVAFLPWSWSAAIQAGSIKTSNMASAWSSTISRQGSTLRLPYA